MPEIDEWYYTDAQQQQTGPVPFAKIKQLVSNEQIQPNTLLWNEDMIKWEPAEKVPGLFLSAPPLVLAPPLDLDSPQKDLNPYAPPLNVAPNTASALGSDTYTCSNIKRCSFGYFSGIWFIGFLLVMITVFPVRSHYTEPPGPLNYYGELQTQEDIQNHQRALNEHLQKFANRPAPTGAIALLAFGTILLLYSHILGLIYLYRAWYILQPSRNARTSPGKAVGYLFIPFYNIYWIFVAYAGWSPDWNNTRNKYSNLSHIPPSGDGLFMAMPIMSIASVIPVIGPTAGVLFEVLFAFVIHKMCKTINAVADTQAY